MKFQRQRPIRVRQSQRGIALVLTLAVLSVLSLIVIGFLVSMRTEQATARNNGYVVIARQLAQAGVDNAIYLMRTNMPVITRQNYYVTQPGGAVSTLPVLTDLLYPPDASGTDNVDLNADRAIIPPNGDYASAAVREVRTGWVNVCTNGMTNGFALLGRYTYWVDDDASKLNLNSANQRNSSYAPTPADVDLTGLLGMDTGKATATRSYAANNGFFTTEQWQLVPSVGAGPVSNNAFYVTVYSKDDNITPWGSPRFNLNDPSITAIANNLQMVAAIAAITNLLMDASLTNWFGPGQDFRSKYGNVTQIAANMIDWIDTDSIPTDASVDWQDQTPPAYLGLEATPYLNELRITNSLQVIDVGAGLYEYTFTTTTDVELWNMYGTNYLPAANTEILLLNRPSLGVYSGGAPLFTYPLPNTATINTGAGLNAPLTNTSYTAVSITDTFVTTNAIGDSVVMSNVTMTAIYRSPVGRIDYALIPLPGRTNTITAPPAFGTNTVGNRQITGCNDPRVKPVSYDWHTSTPTAAGSVGTGANSAIDRQVVSTNGASLIASDGAISGSNDSSSHPISPPTRDKGRIDSVGELGYIHTGWPWRTLCFQAQPPEELTGTNLIPDWIMIDLFSYTNVAVLGRINLNAAVTNISAGAMSRRLRPLQALFTAPLSMSPVDPSTNIYDSILNQTLFVNPPPSNFLAGVMNFCGQVCEVTNFAAGATDEVRERRMRSIANLITVRSNTFTIWTLGQAIQDIGGASGGPPDGVFNGSDKIVAEAKIQTVVERYVDTSSGSSNVAFRTLYFRYITQ